MEYLYDSCLGVFYMDKGSAFVTLFSFKTLVENSTVENNLIALFALNS